MRALFEKFGVEELRQNEKRARLVERAFVSGSVSEDELRYERRPRSAPESRSGAQAVGT
jgi:hypothetical protein